MIISVDLHMRRSRLLNTAIMNVALRGRISCRRSGANAFSRTHAVDLPPFPPDRNTPAHSRKALAAAVQDLLLAGIDRADTDISASLDELQRRLNYLPIPAADL